MTDYTESRKLKYEITKDDGAFLGGPGMYEYDFGCLTDLEIEVYCKECGNHLGTARIRGMDRDITTSGPEITKDTVCEKCGANLYDEKADHADTREDK